MRRLHQGKFYYQTQQSQNSVSANCTASSLSDCTNASCCRAFGSSLDTKYRQARIRLSCSASEAVAVTAWSSQSHVTTTWPKAERNIEALWSALSVTSCRRPPTTSTTSIQACSSAAASI